jgi:hypothetical protein
MTLRATDRSPELKLVSRKLGSLDEDLLGYKILNNGDVVRASFLGIFAKHYFHTFLCAQEVTEVIICTRNAS